MDNLKKLKEFIDLLDRMWLDHKIEIGVYDEYVKKALDIFLSKNAQPE